MRLSCRLAASVALAVAWLCLAGADPARAHAVLLASTPAADAAVAPGPSTLTLRFNSRIDQRRSRLTLDGPGHAKIGLVAAPDAPADTLRASATLPPGGYVLHWQVLATDGHITRGEIPFSVSVP